MCKQCNKTEKENGFQIFKYIINNTCLSSICYNLFRASQKLCRASQDHKQLARRGKLVLEIMLVPDFACIRRTFEHKFLTSNRGCVLYTKLENWSVLHSPKATRRDTKSMTQIGLEEKLFAWVQECQQGYHAITRDGYSLEN